MNVQVRALLRFWWIVVIGLAVAQIAAIMAVYNVDFSSMPPSLSQREKPSYTAEGRLLVTDAAQAFLRRAEVVTVQPPSSGDAPSRPVQVTQAPDNGPILSAASLYPLLIESDQVAKVRDSMFGRTEGVVKAQGIYAVQTPSRFEQSPVPVIQIKTVSDSPQRAIDLVNHTATAFIRWVSEGQKAQGVREQHRISVTPIMSPKEAIAFGGPSSVMPILVFGVILGGFAALAIALDRLFPRRVVVPAESEPSSIAARARA